MLAFGMVMRSVRTESSLLKDKRSRGNARRIQTRGDGGRGEGSTAGELMPSELYHQGMYEDKVTPMLG